MISITVRFPNGETQEVLLAGVPRKGDSIRLDNGAADPSLAVEHVLWLEGRESDPTVVVVVRPFPE